MQQYRSDPRYPKDNQFAEENRARIVRSFPPRLIEREDSLAARFKKNKGSPLRKLEQLYAVMDEFLDVMAPHLPCKPGCSHCCHMKQLALTELEVELIEKRTKHQRRKTLAPTPEKGEPCPFLKYAKGEKIDLTQDEKNTLKHLLQRLAESYRRKRHE